MSIIVDGNKIANEILEDLRVRIHGLRKKPKLMVFLVGENSASQVYVRIKQKKAAEIGMIVAIQKFAGDMGEDDLIDKIKAKNGDPEVSGIIVQLPLPKNINSEKVLNAIDPEKDVDCLTEVNKLKISKGQIRFEPPAAAAILRILDYYKIDLSKGNVLLIGSGDLVGKPLSALFLKRGVNFELANSKTENLRELASRADVIISGVGKPHLISGEMIKKGIVIIDAGTTGSEQGGIFGDVDFESVAPKASLITPVPGGVGPVTVAMLLRNVVKAAETIITSPRFSV